MGSSKKSAAASKTWDALNKAKWPKHTLTRIASLWTDGYSALDIARELGDGYTRNAVIGKLYRMGLRRHGTSQRHKHSATLVPRKSRRQSRDDRGGYAPKLPRSTKANSAQLNLASAASGTKNALVVIEVPLDERRTVLSVTRHQCRWPYESGERLYFCNLDALPGKPYCECHAARARRKDEPSEKSGFTATNSGLKRPSQPPGFRF